MVTLLLVRGREFKRETPLHPPARIVTSAARPRTRVQKGGPLCILRPHGDIWLLVRGRDFKGGVGIPSDPPLVVRGRDFKGALWILRVVRASWGGEVFW